MVTRSKFEAYEEVRKSGITNMFAINKVIELADEMCDAELTKEDCFYIMKNYRELSEKYKGEE